MKNAKNHTETTARASAAADPKEQKIAPIELTWELTWWEEEERDEAWEQELDEINADADYYAGDE